VSVLQRRPPGARSGGRPDPQPGRRSGRDLAADAGQQPPGAAGHSSQLSDPQRQNCELADKFGIRWLPSQALQGVYRNFGTDVGAFNGDGSWALPMPSRYVIAPGGEILYAKINPNYTHRPDPGDVCPVLEKLKASSGA
jgi:hypothetical protein